MKIKEALILDENEPLSKALNEVLDTGTAAIVTKDKKYKGIIDDRNLRNFSVQNPAKIKCKSVIVKPPVLNPDTGILDRIDAFLMGHFKALPVVNKAGKPIWMNCKNAMIPNVIVLVLFFAEESWKLHCTGNIMMQLARIY